MGLLKLEEDLYGIYLAFCFYALRYFEFSNTLISRVTFFICVIKTAYLLPLLIPNNLLLYKFRFRGTYYFFYSH